MASAAGPAAASTKAQGSAAAHVPDDDRPHIEAKNRTILIIAIMMAALLEVLDVTILNVALPHMQAALTATPETITWVLTSYIVAAAVSLPATGWLAGRFGVRNVVIWSVATFIAFSALCGTARTLEEMVIFRIGQGVAGAFLMPLSQSVLLDVTRPSRHASAMSIWGMGVVFGPIMGPIIGGYLTENYNWRWVFYINIPFGLLALAMLISTLPEWERVKVKFDRMGFAMLCVAIGALQLLLDRGTHIDWFNSGEAWIYAALVLSVGFMAIAHLATARNPLFDRDLFADGNFLIANIMMIAFGIALYATLALLPPMLQNLFDYPALDTGLVLASRGLGVLCTMPFAAMLVRKGVDGRALVSFGFIVISISMFIMSSWSLDLDARRVVEIGLMQGVGIGCVFIPLNTLAFATLSPGLRAAGSSLMNLSRSIGSSLGISFAFTLLAFNIQTNHEELGSHVTGAVVPPVDGSAMSRIQPLGEAAIRMIDAEVNRQAMMISYLNDFYLMGWISLAVLPLVLFIRKPKAKSAPPPAH